MRKGLMSSLLIGCLAIIVLMVACSGGGRASNRSGCGGCSLGCIACTACAAIGCARSCGGDVFDTLQSFDVDNLGSSYH
jgi:hypothetical protein